MINKIIKQAHKKNNKQIKTIKSWFQKIMKKKNK